MAGIPNRDAVTAGRADYGRIYFRRPSEQLAPSTIEELADILRSHHQRGQRVTIRNTGHSTNGQTLTEATQVSMANLTSVRFDRDARVATAGPGCSWNDLINAVEFPAFCPPIFPNNPGQRIHVGGTTSVGGVGFYCSKYGGFWNHVSRLKVVTMKGDIIECSATENPEIFRYSVAGYGRIGVIGEIDVDVVPSQPKVLGMVLGYFDDERFERDLRKALDDPAFAGVAAQKDLSGWEAKVLDAVGIDLRLIILMIEPEGEIDVRKTCDEIRRNYNEQIAIYVNAGGDATGLELALRPRLIDKHAVVYFTPTEQSWWRGIWARLVFFFTGGRVTSTVDPTELCHPWTDCLVNPDRYREFMDGASHIINRAGMARYLEKESFLGGLVDIDSFVTFGVRRMWEDPADRLPLSLDLPDVERFTLGVAIMPNVPPKLLPKGMAMSREISDLVYSLGGKRYLYGTHELSPAQVEQHYGRDVLDTWQQLKDEHDPSHLLNIGVIEHLDD